jgi:hypothetical protein
MTADQKASLNVNGWVRLEGALPGEVVDGLYAAAEGQLAAARAAGFWPAPRPDGPDLVLLPNGARSHPVLNEWMGNGTLGAIGRWALGAASVRLLQDAILHKPPRCTGAVPWHCDHTYVGYLQPPKVVSIRVALTPSCEGSGCLRAREGSHRWETALPVQGGASAIPDDALARLAPAESPEVPVPLAAGDVSVHVCRLWHASGPNPSDAPRTRLVFHVADASCVVDTARMSPALAAFMETDADGRLTGSGFPVL